MENHSHHGVLNASPLCFLDSLSVCFCSWGLSNRLMAERLQRRPVGGLPLAPRTIMLIWPLEMREAFPGSLARAKDQNRSSKQLSGMGKSAQSQDSHSLGQLCELGRAEKAAKAQKLHFVTEAACSLIYSLTQHCKTNGAETMG